MILSDRSIREALSKGRIDINPLHTSHIQPSSVDVCLGDEFRVFARSSDRRVIDPTESLSDLTDLVTVHREGGAFSLEPGCFALGTTVECITLSDDLVARIEGKSSLGRIGLLVHATAGYIDPGFNGQVTLELFNLAPLPILLRPGMKIAQISFGTMTTSAEYPYGSPELGSKYQGQTGPTASRYEENYSRG